MNNLLDFFEYISDVPDKIESLISEANRTRGRKEKRKLLQETQELADAYQAHCEAGGNHVKQFNQIYRGD